MATSIVPNDYRTHVALELVTDIATSPENTYYVFLGVHMPQASIPNINDDVNDLLISTYRNMICAKVVTTADASLMINNIPWQANTVYAMYDDQDTLLQTENYFAIVNAGAYSHVWKCLDNNMGVPSTAAPDVSQIDVTDISYRTADGYLWKYMCSSTSANVAKFGTNLFFPVQANTQVTAAAVGGVIDVIKIDSPGSGYQNYLTGQWAAGDIRSNGNTQTYAVTSNATSSSVNGFYTGCNIYISGGTGIGQYKSVVDYFSNANGNFIVIDSPFNTPPQNGSQYQIYPGVNIIGQGRQTINAVARALINAVGNSVSRVDMLVRGATYTYASAQVVSNAVAAPISQAIVRPIYSPYNGHGFDQYGELGASRVSISVQFANSEANTIPATNQYQQVGILKDPVFANVFLNFSSLSSQFLANEPVATFTTRWLGNTAIVTAASANVTVANGMLNSQLSSGDQVFLSTGSQFWYSNVVSVTNSTFMTLGTAPPWACSATTVSTAKTGSGLGTVLSVPGGNSVCISNATGTFVTGTQTIGVYSGAYGIVNTVTRNTITKSFNTLLPLHSFTATLVSGTFAQNEIVYMGVSPNTATSTAALHSVFNNSGTLTLYTSNTVGGFTEDITNQIKGANSGAVATITAKYNSEIVFGSSKVMYVENIQAVTRSNTTTDIINTILEF